MKVKIYSGVEDVKMPEADYGNPDFDWYEHRRRQDQYIEDLKAYCKSHSKSPHAGKVIRFAVADGYASYIILTPSQLIHDTTGDAYHFRYIENFSAADITREIKLQESFSKIFGAA